MLLLHLSVLKVFNYRKMNLIQNKIVFATGRVRIKKMGGKSLENSTEDAKNDIGEVVRRYKDMVYRIAFMRVQNTWDAEDVFQDVFITYMKKQPVCNDEEHRKAWLIRTTINCAKKVTGSTWKNRVEVTDNTETLADGVYEFEEEQENLGFPGS